MAITAYNRVKTWVQEILTHTDLNAEFDAVETTVDEIVTLVDAGIPSAGALKGDTVSETTPAAGVTVDGVKLKDSQVYTDTINEKTGAAGVTIDGVLLKDSVVASAAVRPGAFSGWTFIDKYDTGLITSATADGYIDFTAGGAPDNAIAILSVSFSEAPGGATSIAFMSGPGGDTYTTVTFNSNSGTDTILTETQILVPLDSSARIYCDYTVTGSSGAHVYLNGWIAST